MHMQISTDREDVPAWMQENEMVELPFNIDLLRFLGGEGSIQIVRFRDKLYKFEPGIKAELEHLRLSNSSLCELLARFKETNINHNSLNQQATLAEVGDSPISKQSKTQSDTWMEKARERADIIYKEQKKMGCDPSKSAIADRIAKQFEKEDIRTVKSKRLSSEYIERHALNVWNRPEK